MDWVTVHWGDWWYGFAAGRVFTIVSVVTVWVYTLFCTVRNIRERYSAGTKNTKPTAGVYLYESEQIHPLFR